MTDAMLIKRGEDFTMLDARYDRRGVEEELALGMAKGKRKSLKRMGKEYQRLSSHIGAFPLVLSSPHDIDLIRGTGEERRRLVDMLISQGDAVYLDRALEQRNKMLRDRIADPALYMAVEMQMDSAAEYIHTTRRQWIDSLSGIFDRYYRAIGGDDGHVTLSYRNSLADDGMTSLYDALQRSRHRDETVCHTTVGPHRDDVDMLLDGMPMRRAGSQGQCKTFVIALRLAQYEFLRDTSGMLPMLLLDDIFDKLDASRVEHIMEIVTGEDFGQIFITDTNRTHLDEIMSRTTGDYRMWLVESGKINHTLHP